jgi:prepilin-type N-terminal cleavage/methylation domain-containing protein
MEATMTRRRERGFTLTEMLAVLALVGLATFAIAPIWDALLGSLGRATAALHQPNVAAARASLRSDVQSAASVSPASTWSSEPLLLSRADGRMTQYRLAGARLERCLRTATGTGESCRTVLTKVAAWRWQTSGQLIDIELEVPAAGRAARAPARPARDIEVLRFALRGNGRPNAW